jgi:hypothetical protein
MVTCMQLTPPHSQRNGTSTPRHLNTTRSRDQHPDITRRQTATPTTMVRSHTSELLAKPRTRKSCNRCYSQKLRCLKAADSDTCLRCAKFGAQCIFSARATRPRNQTQSSANPPAAWPPLLSLATELDSQPPNFPTADLLEFPNFITGAPVPYQLWDCHGSPPFQEEAHQYMVMDDAVHDLADLNVKLLDHASTIPPPTDSPPVQAPPGGKLFAIDQTFTLTKNLIFILKGMSAGLSQNTPGTTSITQATVLLLMSCYCRLTDIYESIFVHMRHCAQDPHRQIPNEPIVALPLLQVGSFIPTQMPRTESGSLPPISAYSMHMMLILILSTHLCEQLRDATTTCISGAQSGDMVSPTDATQSSLHSSVNFAEIESQESGFDDMARKSMRKRTHELGEQMRQTKQALMRFSFASL